MTRAPLLGEPVGPSPLAITLPGSGLATTSLGFGCADLYREPSAARRARLLAAAHEQGIRHFDAAPMYGLGLAERELGRFARGRRDDVVLATKFGIAPAAAARVLARVQGPVRRVFAAVPALRRQARARAAGPSSGGPGALLYRSTGFDGASARAGLERSLRALGTGHVDLLLLHDPQPGSVRSDDVCESLEAARAEGRVRAWGVAGEREPALAVARGLPDGQPVLQLRDDVLAPDPAVAAHITFGVLGGALTAIAGHVAAAEDRRRRWRDRVGVDCTDPEQLAPLVLRLAARRNPGGVVLFSTIRSEHLRSAAGAMAAPPGGDDLEAFTRLVDAELRFPGAER
jgi:hypothetical protein